MHIRAASQSDVPAITGIYNQSVTGTTASFDLEPKTTEERERWLAGRAPRHAVLVAEDGERIVGWGALSSHSEREAYIDTADISIYIDEAYQRQGIGAALGSRLLDEGRTHGLHSIIARICTENEASMQLTRNLGFTDVGVMHEVGLKFGRRLDVAVLELLL